MTESDAGDGHGDGGDYETAWVAAAAAAAETDDGDDDDAESGSGDDYPNVLSCSLQIKPSRIIFIPFKNSEILMNSNEISMTPNL